MILPFPGRIDDYTFDVIGNLTIRGFGEDSNTYRVDVTKDNVQPSFPYPYIEVSLKDMFRIVH